MSIIFAIWLWLLMIWWLSVSTLILILVAGIRPEDRQWTKPKWVRVLMIVGGPLTLVPVAVYLFVLVVISIPDLWRAVVSDSRPCDSEQVSTTQR